MNKKIIQVMVVAICFGGSGYVLYSGLHQSKPSVSTAVPGPFPIGTSGSATSSIASFPVGGVGYAGVLSGAPPPISYGTKLNFDIVESQKFVFHTFIYPTVNTSTEVGVDYKQMIAAPPASTK